VVAPLLASGRCRNSEDCASGFGCVDGECIQTGGSEGDMSVEPLTSTVVAALAAVVTAVVAASVEEAEEEVLAVALSLAVAGGGTGGRGGGAPEDCCGERCCRYGEFRGPCAIVAHALLHSRCQKYCDAFYKIEQEVCRGLRWTRPCALNARHVEQVQGFWTECVPDESMLPANANRASVLRCEKCERGWFV
jgi:hypothetical protein